MIVLIRKAVLGTLHLYCHCCQSPSTSCNSIAPRCSEHTQPLGVAVVVATALVTHTHALCFAFNDRRKMRQTTTARAAAGGELPRWYTATLVLTELQAMEGSAGPNDLSAGSTPELLAFATSLERKQCCDVKKENKHCKNFRTKLFSQR